MFGRSPNFIVNALDFAHSCEVFVIMRQGSAALGLSENAGEKEVVREFKKTIADGDEALTAFRTNTRRCVELAALLVDFFDNTQAEAGEKLGYSQQWVSSMLKWRKGGYKGLAFVPLLPAPPPKLPGTGKTPNPEPVRTANGGKLDASDFSRKAKEQLAKAMAGDGVDTEASASARAPLRQSGAEPVEVDAPPTQPEPEPPGKSPEEISAENSAA